MRLTRYFALSTAYETDRQPVRARLLLTRICLFVVVAPWFPIIIVVARGRWELAIGPATAFAAGAMSLMLLRLGVATRRVALLLLVTLVAVMTAFAYGLGGIHAPMAQSLLLVSLVAWLVGDRKLGTFIVVLVSVAMFALAWESFRAGADEVPLRLMSLLLLNIGIAYVAASLRAVVGEAVLARDKSNAELAATNTDLVAARDTAERALSARSRFVAAATHEIRTPMNGILGVAELLEDTELDATQREYIGLIRTSGETLVALINDILDFSKIDAGQLAVETIAFAPRTLLREVTELLSVNARARGLSLETELSSDMPERVTGDPTRLRQVLFNLISNALKFTERGAIRIRTHVVGDDIVPRICFEVEDSGIGMSAAQKERIFEPFAQAEGSTSRRYGGTGLGLTVCRQLVELMGGDIGVRSEPGAGSTFWFEIPLPRASGDASDVRADENERISPTREPALSAHILVAEDNAINQRVISALLQRFDCAVELVDNGRDAVEAVAEHDYDLVLMDCMMPEMNGFDATLAIRRLDSPNASIPIIAMTADAMEGARERCLAAGMNAYVSKPIKRSELADILRRYGDGGSRAAEM